MTQNPNQPPVPRQDEDRGRDPHPEKPGADSGPGLAEWYRLAGLGFEFVAAILLLGGGGWLLDRWLGTQPWMLVVGFGLGFALGLWLMLREARRAFHD